MSCRNPRKGRLSANQAVDMLVCDSDSDIDEIESSDSDNDESDNFGNTGHVTPACHQQTPVTSPSTPVPPSHDTSVTDDWVRSNNFDNFVPDWCPKYVKTPGPNLPVNFDIVTARPVDYFELYFPEEAFTLISDMTNNYAMEYFDQPCEPPPQSRFNAWVETTPNEIKAYIGLQIAMGLCKKPEESDYWMSSGVTSTPGFSATMPRNRYQILNSFLHFCDNSTRVAKGEPGYDALHKIRPLIDIVKPLCKQNYTPKCELSIDETMRKFKGRIFFRQYLPNKPVRWGIKIWSLCESDTGYLLKWDIYTGKNTDSFAPIGDDHSLTDRVVSTLMSDYISCGHQLFVDNYYSSIKLFNYLKMKETGACGTIRQNRVGFPTDLRPANLKLRKGDDPVFYRNGDMLACAWHDTKRVHFLSTISDNGCTNKRIRSKQDSSGFRHIKKPNVACTYNQHMGGVDLFDQKCSYYPYPHKVQKWYHTIYHFIKDLALVNAYIVYKSVNPRSKMSSERFRHEISEELVKCIPPAKNFRRGHKRKSGVSSTEDESHERLTGRHMPMTFEDVNYKPDCIVCSRTRRHPKRKQTRNGCSDCHKPMCVPDCFVRYHNVKYYWE